jgi:predicted dinucleotide-binding enzyme
LREIQFCDQRDSASTTPFRERPFSVRRELRAQDGVEVGAGSFGDSIEDDVVVVLAVPYEAVEPIAQRYESGLSGKVVVDITNPVE